MSVPEEPKQASKALRRPKISMLWILIASVLFTNCALIGWDGLTTRNDREAVRADIHRLFGEIQAGSTKNEVKQAIGRNAFLKPGNKIGHGDSWFIDTPMEVGAGSWVVYLSFKDGEHLSGAFVRTHDSAHYHPPDAPAELGDFKAW